MSKKKLMYLVPIMVAGSLMSGCGNGQDRRAATASTTAEVSADVSKSKGDLDAVLASLNALKGADADADLNKLHDSLKKSAQRLDHSLAEVVASSDDAVKAGKAQEEAWNKESHSFTDAQLREASNQRQGDLRKAVDALAKSSQALGAERLTYTSQLNQTVSALDLDLTRVGLTGIKPTIEGLIKHEGGLRDALSDVAEKIRAERELVSR